MTEKRTLRSPRELVLLLALMLVPPCAALGDGFRAGSNDFDAADPAAPEVTEANLLENERFWPYRVRLKQPLASPVTGKPISPLRPGILVRVEPPGVVRIDFAAEGRVEVPIGDTDVVAAANRVRLGRETKLAPNLVLALGTRLADPTREDGTFALRPDTRPRSYLLLFADPDSEGFGGVAEALAPFRGREDVMTILVPQGVRRSAEVRDLLLAKETPFVFVQTQFTAGYTRSLIDAADGLPYVLLATPEGRIRYQASIAGDADGLAARIEAALPAPPSAVAGS